MSGASKGLFEKKASKLAIINPVELWKDSGIRTPLCGDKTTLSISNSSSRTWGSFSNTSKLASQSLQHQELYQFFLIDDSSASKFNDHSLSSECS